jgi:hypothetical protein
MPTFIVSLHTVENQILPLESGTPAIWMFLFCQRNRTRLHAKSRYALILVEVQLPR